VREASDSTSNAVDSAREAADLKSNAVDSARDVSIPAMDTTTMAREAADSATEVTNAARNKPPLQDQKPLHQVPKPSLVTARNRPKHHDKKSLILMTWNASRLMSSGRELALLHLLTSSAVDIATVTECKMTETAKDFAVAGPQPGPG
jgi:hypothetical protein